MKRGSKITTLHENVLAEWEGELTYDALPNSIRIDQEEIWPTKLSKLLWSKLRILGASADNEQLLSKDSRYKVVLTLKKVRR